jgi:nucleoside-diphosphate-sugar epimerase
VSADTATVLVTGASGFLGGRLVEMLAARGGPVRVLARASSDLRHLSHLQRQIVPGDLQLQIVRGDLSDAAALDEAMRGVRVVYHCAACSTDWAPLATYLAANVVGTQNLLDAAVRAGSVERFLHVSTTDVYGYPRVPCEEGAPMRDVGLPYNRTKIQGEEAVWRAHREHGLAVTVVRPASIYGPRGTAFVTDIAKLLGEGWMALVDGGRARGGFTYVDNVAMAMMQAAENAITVGRAYNICDGANTTWREYTNALADALGHRRPRLVLPFRAAMAVAGTMEAMAVAGMMETPFALLKLANRPMLTRHAVYLLARDQEYPATRAREDFGFSPQVSFAEGIARSAAWVRSQLT